MSTVPSQAEQDEALNDERGLASDDVLSQYFVDWCDGSNNFPSVDILDLASW